ncbi:MAG TPA: hypothetical protein PKC67_13525 [Kiritimatiellia bacterium]|nr:hypothetical protein [Kiritimatiellia bacterium]HMP35355.1 hypothetical protein [Kiritimatiellia bacterium]
MAYQYLGLDLHDTADKAQKYFKVNYGAKSFQCEQPIADDLALRPTWQAKLHDGYDLIVNVQSQPFSQTLHEFVNKCVQASRPVVLWVAVLRRTADTTFNQELRTARQMGAGVIDFPPNGDPHVFHLPVAFSLFALNRCDKKTVPTQFRQAITSAEETFLNGAPGQGCQSVCQELEDLSRRALLSLHSRGCFLNNWNPGNGAAFFNTGDWGPMLQGCENRIDVNSIRRVCPDFNQDLIVRARGFRDWRNSVSHKPKTLKDLVKRDARLRTMFEATRDLLIDWANATKPLKLK